MKILGITAEYDPFHNGHRYHLQTAKEKVSPDACICVMSGDFTQRGEPALLDKWTRAKIAADQGLDLVLELPFLYACSPASSFASTAVDMLVLAGAGSIAFGCEAEDPGRLEELARLQIEKADILEEAAREEMRSGISHVKARANASNRLIGEELTRLSLAPNNILALEYLKRMIFWQEKGVEVEPVPIVRKGSGYKEIAGQKPDLVFDDGKGVAEKNEEVSAEICGPDEEYKNMAGGSAIREMIDAGWDVDAFVPYDSSNCQWIDLDSARAEILKQLKGIALRSSPEDLSKLRFIGEGIENRLIREITDAETYKALLRRMTSKRYTSSTIRRMLISILLQVRGDEGGSQDNQGGAAAKSDLSPGIGRDLYGRVLAMTGAGRAIIGSEPKLPFIVNVNRTDGISEEAKECLEMDIRAADMYNLITGRDVHRFSDYRQKPYVRD